MPRLEAAACPICMDTLFNNKDDLDEDMPIATPDCGHVFHEICLLKWFKIQEQNYQAECEVRGIEWHKDDTPAECPQCRTECYADENSEPTIHRLYINFGEASNPPSSQPASSPARWNTLDKQLLGLSRRAKGLTSELSALSPDSQADDVMGTLMRVKTLQKDIVSNKAAEAFKNYAGGLTRALHQLRTELEEHPLIPVLIGQLETSRRAHTDLANEVPAVIAMSVRDAVRAEQEKATREINKAIKEKEEMQREWEKEKVARVVAKRAATEREEAKDARIKELERKLKREEDDHNAANNLVTERTRLLKMYQAKAESKKEMKRKLEEQEQTIAELKISLEKEKEGSSRISSQVKSQSRPVEDDIDLDDDMFGDITDADLSIQELPPMDDTLIDLDEDAPRAGRSTTARSYMYFDEGPSSKKSAKPISRTVSNPAISKPAKKTPTPWTAAASKYFPDKEKSSRVLVEASSPIAPSPKRKRTVVDITSSSPEPPRAALRSVPVARNNSAPRGNILEQLGIQQGKGKQKGLVLGTKYRRRA